MEPLNYCGFGHWWPHWKGKCLFPVCWLKYSVNTSLSLWCCRPLVVKMRYCAGVRIVASRQHLRLNRQNNCIQVAKDYPLCFCCFCRNVWDLTRMPLCGRPNSKCCAPWLNLCGMSWTMVCSSPPQMAMMQNSLRRRGCSKSTHSPSRKGYPTWR